MISQSGDQCGDGMVGMVETHKHVVNLDFGTRGYLVEVEDRSVNQSWSHQILHLFQYLTGAENWDWTFGRKGIFKVVINAYQVGKVVHVAMADHYRTQFARFDESIEM